MRLQIALHQLSVVAALLAGCATSSTDAQRQGVEECRSSSALEGLRIFVNSSSGPEQYAFGRGSMSVAQLSSEEFLKIPREGSLFEYWSDVYDLPGGESLISDGEEYRLPVARSDRTDRWAAGVTKRGAPWLASAVVVRGPQVTRRLESAGDFSVVALAWSGNFELLARLEGRVENRVRSLSDFLSPHPVPYNDILLTVFDLDSGKEVCRSLLRRNVRYAQSKIVWR